MIWIWTQTDPDSQHWLLSSFPFTELVELCNYLLIFFNYRTSEFGQSDLIILGFGLLEYLLLGQGLRKTMELAYIRVKTQTLPDRRIGLVNVVFTVCEEIKLC
jgi:hypothetical protein